MAKKTSISELINSKNTQGVIKKREFNVSDYDFSLGGKSSSAYKKEQHLRLSDPIEEALNTNGLIPISGTTIIRGHSDTGKSTLLIEVAKACQREGIFIVFLITEMKWSFEHLIDAGFQCERVVEEDVDENTGEVLEKITYVGDFIYRDVEELPTIESVAQCINKVLADQRSGKLPRDIMFLWDSAGVVPCKQTIETGNANNMWDGGAMSREFTQVCKNIGLTRKASNPYHASLVVVNHITVTVPMGFMEQPKMKNKGGDALWKQASLQITFGGIKDAGTSSLKATSKGKELVFGKVTKVQIEKQHTDNGISAKGKLVMTKHGFIANTKEAIDAYKKQHQKSWVNKLGANNETEIELVIEEENNED